MGMHYISERGLVHRVREGGGVIHHPQETHTHCDTSIPPLSSSSSSSLLLLPPPPLPSLSPPPLPPPPSQDLAARNVLVGSTEICKVADFGLLREIPRDDSIYHSQHNVPCPIRWMPPESISDRHFSPASDVWSFGVLVWEMFNPTKLPYAKYDNIGCATKVGEAVLFDVVEGMHDSFDLFIHEAMCMWCECNEYIPGRGITLIIIIHV